MNVFRPSVGAAVAVLVLVFAQDVFPGFDFYHTWQYATILAIASVIVAGAAWSRRTRWEGLAALGVLVVAVAGLASGLLGPDTATIARAPGTVAPLPSLGVAAFFGQADADVIARGDATIVLRRPGHAEIELGPGSRKLFGPAVLGVHPQTVAYIEAYTTTGERLTVTQPTNATFLSPLLLFGQTQTIAGKSLPFDAFALPGKNLIVHAVYFAPGSTGVMSNMPSRLKGAAAILFAVDDALDRPLGIAIGADRKDTPVGGGVRLRATFGTYPALTVASAPYPLALAGGGALIAAGLTGIVWRWRSAAAVRVRTPSCS